MFNTPILFLVFNRPDTTIRVFERIRAIQPKFLYVAADGPRLNKEGEKEKCETVRKIATQIDWDCELITLFRDENLGCGRAPSEAIMWFFNHVEEGIILEDDCLPDISFFSFCEELLDVYRDSCEVMHIGGHSLGVKHDESELESYFLSNYPHIWGWATWRKSWMNYKYHYDILEAKLIVKNNSNIATLHEANTWIKIFETILNPKRMIDFWDYQWLLTLWKNNGVAILPKINLVKNIGFGVDATHTTESERWSSNIHYGNLSVIHHPKTLEVKVNKTNDLQMSNSHFGIDIALSPVNKTENVTFLKKINTDDIILGYKNQFKIDVARHFENIESFSLFRCNQTSLKFFHPSNISGDNFFYEDLEKFDWYYMPYKWEHRIAKKYIKSGMEILEVGCAKGGFLSIIKNSISNVMITGLELNQRAVFEAQDSGLNVVNETIEKHAINNRDKYHLVCSFQVVEHIIDIKSFMDSQVVTLKEGGKLIICVPNNNSFIKWEQNHLLNMPPHHMTLWNEISLRKLAVEYPLKVENVFYEPLQSYHFDWFRTLFIERYFSSGIRKKIFGALKLNYFFKKIIPLTSPFIKGHSIFVVYKKY